MIRVTLVSTVTREVMIFLATTHHRALRKAAHLATLPDFSLATEDGEGWMVTVEALGTSRTFR